MKGELYKIRKLVGEITKEHLRYDKYLYKKAADPSYTFRKHLKVLGGAIEE